MENPTINERIIYFDQNFCVVTKLAGENSQTDIPIIFKDEIESRLEKKIDFIECPHRLDMPVSGVQIIAFNKTTFDFFTKNFQNNKIHKTYWAIVEGLQESENGTLQDYLVFNTKKQKAFLYDEEVRKSKKVILDYQIIGKGQKYSFVEVNPKTGRTHQIRAQLAKNSMVIKGDVKYGARRSDSIPGIRLFAKSIKTPIPNSKEIVEFVSPIFPMDNLWISFVDEHNSFYSKNLQG